MNKPQPNYDLEKEVLNSQLLIIHYKELVRDKLIDPELASKLIEVQEGIQERANILLNQV